MLAQNCRAAARTITLTLLLTVSAGCALTDLYGREVATELSADPPYVMAEPPGEAASPVVIFSEGDGSYCQGYSEAQWRRFVSRRAGHYALVWPRTRVNDTCGTPAFDALDFRSRVDELVAVIDAIRRRFPKRAMVLVGHSAGAEISLRAAMARPEAIGRLVNLSGGFLPVERVIAAIPQARYHRGLSSDETLKQEEADAAEMLRAVRANADSTAPFWGRTYRFWAQLCFSDVFDLWRRVTIPVLVLHGEDDLASVPSESVVAGHKALLALGRSNVELRILPGLGHDLLGTDVWGVVDAWLSGTSQVPRRVPGRST